MLSILSADLGESPRSKILLVLKTDSVLPRVIFFVLGVSVIDLWPSLCLVFLA